MNQRSQDCLVSMLAGAGGNANRNRFGQWRLKEAANSASVKDEHCSIRGGRLYIITRVIFQAAKSLDGQLQGMGQKETTAKRWQALRNKRLFVAGLLILWLGFALRLHNLAGDSFWIDEILTVNSASGGLGAITAVEDHPPLLYALTLFSTSLIGEGEFAARWFAFLAGFLALPLLMLMGKVMGRPIAGRWAALLLALVPFHIGLSQTARHYSFLVTITLATYLALSLALKRSRWLTWLLYAGLTLLNLYMHYAAFVVLTSQALLIGAWLFVRLTREGMRRESWLKSLVAGMVVLLLYLPWLTRFFQALEANIGQGVETGTGTATPISQRIGNVIWNFNIDGPTMAYILVVLFLVGLFWLLWRREYLEATLILSATVVSLGLITVFQVARGPYARYISFLLPFYLLSAGIALEFILLIGTRRLLGTTGQRLLTGGVAVFLVAVAWPNIQHEYDFVLEDWRGILIYLDDVAEENDILVGISMNHRRGFNLVNGSLPYYLENVDSDYLYLPGNQLQGEDIGALLDVENDVWAVIFDWDSPSSLEKSSQELTVEPFQTALYVVGVSGHTGSSLDKVDQLYSQLIPLVSESTQRCLLMKDKVSLTATAGDWPEVDDELASILNDCPELSDDPELKQLERSMLLARLMDFGERGQTKEARSIAAEILTFDRKNALALEVLTAIDLGERYAEGKVEVWDELSPEPVRIERFTMPQNGDWGDVLLVHPPASVSFTLQLPREPVNFESRVALAPQSWAWGGDGATFVLRIQPVDEESRELLRQHIGNSKIDHDWHDVTISLADYAGQTVTLSLTTENGPAGDGTGDWAGWESPRLLWAVPDQAD